MFDHSPEIGSQTQICFGETEGAANVTKGLQRLRESFNLSDYSSVFTFRYSLERRALAKRRDEG